LPAAGKNWNFDASMVRIDFYDVRVMDSTQVSVDDQSKKRSNLKSYLSDIALKTGLSEQEVAKVSRLLFKKIRGAIEEGETFHTPTLVIQSVSKPPKPENEKRPALPQRRVGRIILKNSRQTKDQE